MISINPVHYGIMYPQPHTMKNYFNLLLLFLVTLVGVSCKKDDNTLNPPSDCRIVKITDEYGKSLSITYNTAGEYQTIKDENDNTTTSFTYSSSSIIGNTTNVASLLVRKTTFALNSQGMAYGVRQDYYDPLTSTPTGWSNLVYEYNGTQLIKGTATNSGNATPRVVNYVWSDGNLTSQSSAGSSTFIEYYTDKVVQPGDYMNVLLTKDIGLPAVRAIRNKNLIKGEGSVQISYVFDNDGKISAVSLNGLTAFTLQYECN